MLIPTEIDRPLNKEKSTLVFSLIAASAVIHTPTQFLERWLNAASVQYGMSSLNSPPLLYFVNSLRALLFLISLAALLWIFMRPVLEYASKRKLDFFNRKTMLGALAVFFSAGILVLPSRLGIMGVGYAEMSKDPFIFRDGSNQIYQRLLLPALAYFLQFKGPVLYYLFSLLLTFILILCTLLFLRSRDIQTSYLENLSIAVSTFIITQFQSPGYTEQLSLIIILLMVTVPLGLLPKIAGMALALFAHEVSILLIVPVAMLYFSKEEKLWGCLVVFVYCAFWLMSFGLDPGKLMAVRTVGGESGFAWLIHHPLRELGGIAASYKLLWIPMLLGLSSSAYRKQIILFILPGIAATMFGVDTSRLMAFGLLACLTAIVAVKKYTLLPERHLRLLFGLNLCLPSVYIGLNSGLVYFNGLYQLCYRGIFIQ